MLSQNKKIITYAAIALIIVLIMLALIGFVIQFLAKELNQALAYKASAGPVQGFDFESLKSLNIKEINDLLTPSTSTISTSIISTSTKATSTPATSTTSTVQ